MMRKPIVSGQFYPDDKEELLAEIKKCFTSKFGPGTLPGGKGNEKIYGAIVPHAGYPFSGPGAAHVYKAIKECKKPELILILGTNHQYRGRPCTMKGDWETPLDIAKVDDEFADILVKNGAVEDDHVHQYEHSIEVQIPFLQFIYGDGFVFVPLIIGDDDYEKNAELIERSINDSGKDVLIIASSDFTHYGINYGYMPFTDDVKNNMEKLDKGAIKFIEKGDAWAFNDYVNETGATICGRYNVAVLIQLMKGHKAKLLTYYTSGDVVGDFSSAVGYASIIFE